MKKKVLFSLGVLVLALSLALPIAAGVGAQESDKIYGITTTGEIYEIDPINQTETKVAEVDECPVGGPTGNGPNGLAYDQNTNRIYYTEYFSWDTVHPDIRTSLYFIDLDTGDETFAGFLDGEIANADIYQGCYYYIAGGYGPGDGLKTDNLYKVQLLADGTIGPITLYADITGNANHAWAFNGDIAIQDGVVYGSGKCFTHGQKQEHFQVNCDGTGFQLIRIGTGEPQLAFGLYGQLYAHNSGQPPSEARKMFFVDWDGGPNPPLFAYSYTATQRYSDLASTFTGEPNEIGVSIDIKPTSCPNPLNVRSNGVLPVAILGTDEFDVTQVDPATVRLEGVAPLRWAIEDVAAPYGDTPEDCEDCTTDGPDGYDDLTLKFDTQAIVAALGEVNDGDCVELVLTGTLKTEFGGTAIAGVDYVVILKKGRP